MAAPRKDNVKEMILENTERLMKHNMLSDISLAEIARVSGISKGTLYYYYKSKNEILFDITDKYLDKQFHDLVTWTENKSKDTSLERLVKYVMQRDIETVEMRMHLFYDAMLGNEEIRQKLVDRYSEFAKLIAEKISQRTHEISPEFLTWLILLTSDGLFIQKMLQNDHINMENFILEGSQWIKRIVSTRSATGKDLD